MYTYEDVGAISVVNFHHFLLLLPVALGEKPCKTPDSVVVMHDKIAGGEALEFFEGKRDSARADAVAL